MKYLCIFSLAVSILACDTADQTTQSPEKITARKKYALVIHGGISDPLTMSQEKLEAHEEGLREALRIGKKILEENGTGIDAVEQVIRYLEDHPEFNAGKGASLTTERKHELDASIMDGKTLGIGAITGVTTVRHPISLARRVMDSSKHVFFWNTGAEEFADRQSDLERVENDFFTTEEKKAALEEKMQETALSCTTCGPEAARDSFYGTVGVAALDSYGNLAAGTSTGGGTGKQHGRIGDSPVIGAATYANNHSCAISCTGKGEEFIRHTVSAQVSSLVRYQGLSLQAAVDTVLQQRLKPGDGGIIGVDKWGNTYLGYNTNGMFCSAADSDGLFEVRVK